MDKSIELAIANIKNAYAPYSHFAVSAVVELNDGTLFKGTNVENAAYGLTNCAERSALFSAYSDGVRKSDIRRIVIYTDHDYFVTPCGACRQVMAELMREDADVVLVNNHQETKIYKNAELLPDKFSERDL